MVLPGSPPVPPCAGWPAFYSCDHARKVKLRVDLAAAADRGPFQERPSTPLIFFLCYFRKRNVKRRSFTVSLRRDLRLGHVWLE